MNEITFEYWNKLADQIITISSLLGGFSIAVIANLLVSDINTRLSKIIMIVSTLAASFFLVSVFAWTTLLMKTTADYPLEVLENDLILPRIVGAVSFFLGILSLITMISLAGWTKSKKMGKFTTVIGFFSLILILIMVA